MKTLLFRNAIRLSMAMTMLSASVCVVSAQEQTTPDASNTRTLLLKPKVGDLYAAELAGLSGVGFNSNNGTMDEAYGLLKVVRVDRNTVTVITETGAWPQPQGSRDDLHSDLSTITWDESEEIPLDRKQLLDLHSQGRILEARRLPRR